MWAPEHQQVLMRSPHTRLSWLDRLVVSLLLLAALYFLAKRCVWLFVFGARCIMHTSRCCYQGQCTRERHAENFLVHTGVWVCLLQF